MGTRIAVKIANANQAPMAYLAANCSHNSQDAEAVLKACVNSSIGPTELIERLLNERYTTRSGNHRAGDRIFWALSSTQCSFDADFETIISVHYVGAETATGKFKVERQLKSEQSDASTGPTISNPGETSLLAVVAMLAHQGIQTTISSDGTSIRATFEDGFYKSDGCAYLDVRDQELYLNARYGESTKISSMADIVQCSQKWYEQSKDRFSGWESPPENWAKLYERHLVMTQHSPATAVEANRKRSLKR